MKTAYMAVLGFALVTLLAWSVPSVPDADLRARAFWSAKAHAPASFDVVIAGDSRIYRGLSPRAFERCWARRVRVLNFGFSSAGLSPEYLDAAVAKLCAGAKFKVLLLGVTAHSLTEGAARNEHWKESLDMRTGAATASGSVRWSWSDLFRERIAPPMARLQRATQASPTTVYEEEFEADGWVRTIQWPLQPQQALSSYREQLSRYPLTPARLEEFAGALRRISAAGISIFVVRPPATAEMDQLEAELGRFDEVCVRRLVMSAGARWLDVPREGFTSYDGSHLDAASAEVWSDLVAGALAQELGVERR